jgi:hypothetical protein
LDNRWYGQLLSFNYTVLSFCKQYFRRIQASSLLYHGYWVYNYGNVNNYRNLSPSQKTTTLLKKIICKKNDGENIFSKIRYQKLLGAGHLCHSARID